MQRVALHVNYTDRHHPYHKELIYPDDPSPADPTQAAIAKLAAAVKGTYE